MGRLREGADRVDCGEQLVEVAESFNDEEIDAAFFESAGLLFENREDLFMWQVADLGADTRGPIEPAIRVSSLAASRASRAILTPRWLTGPFGRTSELG